eukprot:6210554-Pleurochrysis_carterae.AAC.2
MDGNDSRWPSHAPMKPPFHVRLQLAFSASSLAPGAFDLTKLVEMRASLCAHAPPWPRSCAAVAALMRCRGRSAAAVPLPPRPPSPAPAAAHAGPPPPVAAVAAAKPAQGKRSPTRVLRRDDS